MYCRVLVEDKSVGASSTERVTRRVHLVREGGGREWRVCRWRISVGRKPAMRCCHTARAALCEFAANATVLRPAESQAVGLLHVTLEKGTKRPMRSAKG